MDEINEYYDKHRSRQHLLSLLLMPLLMTSCITGPKEDNGNEINSNIFKIKDCCDYISSMDYYMGQVSGDILIATSSITRFSLDSDFRIVSQEDIWQDFFEKSLGGAKYFSLSKTDEVFLFTKTMFGNASMGSLYEYDLSSKQALLLKDSTYNISTAVYWHGDDNKLIYYSYGNDEGLQAGYYLYDITTGQDSLLLAHSSAMGYMLEILNGFDLSPDNRKLLIPYLRVTQWEVLPPKIIEYDLHTQQADTFDVAFDLSFVRIGLWLRYSPDGTKILYCNFPYGFFTYTTNDDSEVGIIDVATRQKQVLDVNTNAQGTRRSVQLAPTWSPDGQHLIYGSAPLSREGIRGRASIYVLKNVVDPRNYKLTKRDQP